MEIEEDIQVGFEEAMSWLPSHVVAEACDSNFKVNLRNESHRERRHGLKSAADPAVPVHSKYSLKPHQKSRFPTNWASGGPGMQAIFLDSGRRSCGTGVFLPRRAGTNFQPSKKPVPKNEKQVLYIYQWNSQSPMISAACSPVLLPSRVVHALNLNVHALGLQVSPQKDVTNSNNPKAGNPISVGNKNGKEVSTHQNSQEIFLPKEWTY
ncbi:hypothetical protein CK203_002695 [Vitis vinifera]|uniref:Uncharacterized protein n=1 Tax=Vitis vinifera TaxID=29760 RepID=A0A438KHK7_VITVI|nr:hypothetical protein CK203_002695 [Vitis vinifera]